MFLIANHLQFTKWARDCKFNFGNFLSSAAVLMWMDVPQNVRAFQTMGEHQGFVV